MVTRYKNPTVVALTGTTRNAANVRSAVTAREPHARRKRRVGGGVVDIQSVFYVERGTGLEAVTGDAALKVKLRETGIDANALEAEG